MGPVVAVPQTLEYRLNSCGAWAWLFHVMGESSQVRDRVSPALSGCFFTTGPPGKTSVAGEFKQSQLQG